MADKKSELPEGISHEKLDKMSWENIVGLRSKYSGDKAMQELLAPYDHQAMTREAVQANPLAAVAYALMIPGYTAAKAAHALPEDENTSPASVTEITAGFRGIAQGLGIIDDSKPVNQLVASINPK